MYKREVRPERWYLTDKKPICTSAKDVEAFNLYQEARRIECEDPQKAMQMFRKAFKLSQDLAEVLRL